MIQIHQAVSCVHTSGSSLMLLFIQVKIGRYTCHFSAIIQIIGFPMLLVFSMNMMYNKSGEVVIACIAQIMQMLMKKHSVKG